MDELDKIGQYESCRAKIEFDAETMDLIVRAHDERGYTFSAIFRYLKKEKGFSGHQDIVRKRYYEEKERRGQQRENKN